MIEYSKLLIPAGVGLIDWGLENNPVSLPGGINGQDAFRVGLTLGSFAVNMLGYEKDLTETIFIATLPLTIKTVANWISGMVAGQSMTVPQRTYRLDVYPPSPVQRKKLVFVGLR